MSLTILNILKGVDTIFIAIAAIYFSCALWKSETNVDLVGNGIYTLSMVIAIIFMWMR